MIIIKDKLLQLSVKKYFFSIIPSNDQVSNTYKSTLKIILQQVIPCFALQNEIKVVKEINDSNNEEMIEEKKLDLKIIEHI